MSFSRHLWRVVLLMTAAGAFLTWHARRTEVMYADGLRYVAQAQALGRGSWERGLTRSVDHPAYPIAIAAAHALTGGDSPQNWQTAAQVASVVSAVLLVVPLYLLALEFHGATAAWLACLLTFLVPLSGHVLADVLSEGTFLLYWTWGLWAAVRFLREGRTTWLLPAIAGAGMAYLTRPEGVLLPVALSATLVLTAFFPTLRLSRPRWWRAMAVLLLGPLAVAGPYIALKGGIATKPAVARLLGTAPRSNAMAVERERPLEEGQSIAKTYLLGTRAMARAVAGAVTPPLLVLALIGAFARRARAENGRSLLLIGFVCIAWTLALIRLYVTGGYCTPRHALILALPLIAAAARGIELVAAWVTTRLEWKMPLARRALMAVFLIIFAGRCGHETLAPLNSSFRGYRQAGDWLAAHSAPDARVLDLKGWATFYARRHGYGFAELDQAREGQVDWVVAHDAFLSGPWHYCQFLREKVKGLTPVRSFPETRTPGLSQVHVFALRPELAQSIDHQSAATR